MTGMLTHEIFRKAIKMAYICRSIILYLITIGEFRKAKRSLMAEVIKESFFD